MLRIRKSHLESLGEPQGARRVEEMSCDIQKDFADSLVGRDPTEIDETVARTVSIMRYYGIQQEENIYLLAAFCGPDFADQLGRDLPAILDETYSSAWCNRLRL